jgi:hypothetical protein
MTDDQETPQTTPMSPSQRRRLRQRTGELRRRMSALDSVVTGSVYTRYRVCGKASCRCARDPSARHGPYYQWSHQQDGRQRHEVVSEQHAERLREAIANYQELRELLRQWERESLREIFADGAGARDDG